MYYFFFLLWAAFFLFWACVKAEAATLLTAFDVPGSDSSLAALEATDFDVCSFLDFAMVVKFIE